MGIFNKKQTTTAQQRPSTTVLTSNISPELVVNSISDGVVAIDSQGNIQLINQPAVDLTGYSGISDAVGLNFATVIILVDKGGEEVKDASNPILASLKSSSLFSSRALQLRNQENDRKTPISLTIAPILGGGVVISFKNIEQEIKEENEQMEFISTASHEMRTPIASIEGYLSLALNPATAAIDPRAKDYLTKASEVSKHLGKLFQDLLDTTKLSENKLKANSVPVEITELVKSIASELVPQVTDKGLSMSFNGTYIVGKSINEGPKETRKITRVFYAKVDVSFIREIVDNLIENAIKYTPNGEIIVTVTGDSDTVVISVKDSGIGISKDDITHVFQKFYRADNSDTRTIGGTGLGLFIAKQRAEELGGDLYAESEPGEGSTFFLKLPRLSDSDFAREKAVEANSISIADPTPQTTAPQPQAPQPQQLPAPAPQPVAPAQVVQPAVVSQPIAPVQAVAPVAQPAPAQPSGPAGSLAPDQLAALKAAFQNTITNH